MSTLRSIRNLARYPAGRPLSADDFVEFHASRLLLLVHICGAGRIDGLTKLAKLDFFIRYPSFFASACRRLKKPAPPYLGGTETEMVRHHYGPWDHRYYHVLAYLEAKRLITVTKGQRNSYVFELTELGLGRAAALADSPLFEQLSRQMDHVRSVLGARTGGSLKNLIYQLFQHEVAERPMGETIR